MYQFSNEAIAFASAVAFGFLTAAARIAFSASPASSSNESAGVDGLLATVKRISNCLFNANSARTEDGQSLRRRTPIFEAPWLKDKFCFRPLAVLSCNFIADNNV